MQNDYHNKGMGAPANKRQDSPAPKTALEEFFYPGDQKYEPQTVQARSKKEADEIWEQTRREA